MAFVRSDLGVVVESALVSVAGMLVLIAVNDMSGWHQNGLSAIRTSLLAASIWLPATVICLVPYALMMRRMRRRERKPSCIAHVAIGIVYFTFLLSISALYFNKGIDPVSDDGIVPLLRLASVAGAISGTLFWLVAWLQSRYSDGTPE